jgi:hypothetical protein
MVPSRTSFLEDRKPRLGVLSPPGLFLWALRMTDRALCFVGGLSAFLTLSVLAIIAVTVWT